MHFWLGTLFLRSQRETADRDGERSTPTGGGNTGKIDLFGLLALWPEDSLSFSNSVFLGSDTDSIALPDSRRSKRLTSLPRLLPPASCLWFPFPRDTEGTEQGLHPFSSAYLPSSSTFSPSLNIMAVSHYNKSPSLYREIHSFSPVPLENPG